MKNFILVVFGILTLGACQKEGSRGVTNQTSPNGQAFTFMPIYEDGVTDVTIEFAWPTTWAYEEDKNPAVPFVGSKAILSGGTSELSPQDVLIMFEDKSAFGDMEVQTQHIIGSVSFPKEYVDEVLDVVHEMLVRPQFNDRWLEREKSEFSKNVKINNSNTDYQMWAAARYAIFGDQPANRTFSLADPNIIAAVTQSDVRRWHRDVITKTGVTVVVTGAISAKDAGVAVDHLLADLPDGQPVEMQPASANFAPVEIYLHDPDAPQTVIGFVGQLPVDDEVVLYEIIWRWGSFHAQVNRRSLTPFAPSCAQAIVCMAAVLPLIVAPRFYSWAAESTRVNLLMQATLWKQLMNLIAFNLIWRVLVTFAETLPIKLPKTSTT